MKSKTERDEENGAHSERYRLLVEQLPYSLQIIDPSGRIVRVNRAWERLWGITLDQLGDYNLLEDPQLEASGVMPYLRRAFAGEAAEIPPVAYVPDRGAFAGQTRWTRAVIYPVRSEEGALSEVVLVHEDITAARVAEQQLRASEERFRSIYQHAATGIAITDLQGQFVQCNPAYSEIVGYTEEELRALGFPKLVHPDDVEENNIRTRSLVAGEMPFFKIENRYVHRNGANIWVQKVGSILRSELDAPAFIITLVTDITERKNAEERGTFQKQLLEALTESVLDGILIVSPEGRMIHFNQQFLALWSFPEDVIASQSDEAALHWAANQTADPAVFLERVAQVYQHPNEAVREELAMKDGRVFERFGSPIQSGDARLGWVWTFRDVSERRHAEAELREKEAFVRLLLDSAADAFYGVDRDGVTTFCNAAFLRALGFTSEDEVIGRALHDVIHHSHPDGTPYAKEQCPIYHTAQTGQSAHRDDERLFRKDGSSFPVEYWAHPIVREGELRGAVTTFLDITERQQAESALRRAMLQAEEANRVKDEFLAMLSHELRTPLTPVLMATAAIRSDPAISDQVRADLEMIQRNIELETLLIDDLLDLTRIAYGKYELHREPVDVHTSVAEALAISQSEIEGKALLVVQDLAAAEHHCWADSARLQQVFWNIIKNAVKFTPAGGELRIRTLNDEAHHLLIEFADTGVGIEPQLQPKIFDAFEQGGRGIHARHGGLGLGLAISKRVVDLLNGEITVQSEGTNCGTTFMIKLDAMQTSLLGGVTYPLATAETQARKLSLLLIEDHADTARTLRRMLERVGYHVAHAASIAAAHSLLAGSDFDLIISDLGLPDGSALDFLREFRRDRATPAIAISGFGMQSDLAASRSAGFDEHLTKPVEWERLHAEILRLTAPAAELGASA